MAAMDGRGAEAASSQGGARRAGPRDAAHAGQDAAPRSRTTYQVAALRLRTTFTVKPFLTASSSTILRSVP